MGGAHLEELDADAGEHELQEGGDQDDVPDCADGHKHALHHVLGSETGSAAFRPCCLLLPPRSGEAERHLGGKQGCPASPFLPLFGKVDGTHALAMAGLRFLESGSCSPSFLLPGFCPRPLTFSPLALLMARRGRSTLSTLRIFTTEMALDLGEGSRGVGAEGSLLRPRRPPAASPPHLRLSVRKPCHRSPPSCLRVPSQGKATSCYPVAGRAAQ